MTTEKTIFTPDELKASCLTALSQWDFNPDDYREEWGSDAETYVNNYKLVLQQMIEEPESFMDDEEDKKCLNLENHPVPFTGSAPDIWEYLTSHCESFAALWTN